MPSAWMPGAARYPVGTAGSLVGGPAKCTLHTTESNPEITSAMAVAKWMAANKSNSVYHLIYHPITDEMVQMLPATGSAKALSNLRGGVETNRMGRVHIQVSVVAYSANPFTKFPMRRWPEVLAWIDSWGVPRKWYGKPPKGVVDHVSTDTWIKSSGWAGHCCAPESNHHDPGAIDLNILFAGKPATKPPSTQPPKPPSSTTFQLAFDGGAAMTLRYLKRTDPMMKGHDVTHLQRCLTDEGCSPGSADGVFGDATSSAVKKFQGKKGLPQDGVAGPDTMTRIING